MKKSLKGILIVVIVIAIAIGGYFLFKENTLKTDSSEVKELYSFLGSNDLSICNGLMIYSDKEINVDNLSEQDKLCIAYSLIDSAKISNLKITPEKKEEKCNVAENIDFPIDDKDANMCNITKFTAQDIKDNYKKIYNKELVDLSSFNYDIRYICKSDGDFYYCGSLEEFTITVGSEPRVYRSIEKAVEKNNTIEIYDYFLRVINKECYSDYVTEIKKDKCTSKFDEGKVNYKFLKKYGTYYKHTYIKDSNGNYHWSKSEPVK